MAKVYLAGPDVFLPNALEVGANLKALCAKYGLQGVFPLDSKVKLDGLDPYEQGIAIYWANVDLIKECDALLVNMTPFRGPSMDVGTAFEVGYGAALSKILMGYTEFGAGSLYKERVKLDGNLIEDFGMVDNLMVDAPMEGIFDTAEEAIKILAEEYLD
jgi:nucleoside 2-deoxyribosyltransferase